MYVACECVCVCTQTWSREWLGMRQRQRYGGGEAESKLEPPLAHRIKHMEYNLTTDYYSFFVAHSWAQVPKMLTLGPEMGPGSS